MRAVVAAVACAPGAVDAQLSGSVGAVSDYRYRGVSLSRNDPAVQAAVNYDDATGFYGGAFVSTVQFPFESSREWQAIGYLGYAWRLRADASAEVGVDYAMFTRTHSYDYPEIYVGFASGNASGRLYYSPRYFGYGGDTVYGELNGAYPLFERVRLIAHGGVLWSGGTNPFGATDRRTAFDGYVGISVDVDPVTLQLTFVARSNGANASYPFGSDLRRNGVVLGVTLAF